MDIPGRVGAFLDEFMPRADSPLVLAAHAGLADVRRRLSDTGLTPSSFRRGASQNDPAILVGAGAIAAVAGLLGDPGGGAGGPARAGPMDAFGGEVEVVVDGFDFCDGFGSGEIGPWWDAARGTWTVVTVTGLAPPDGTVMLSGTGVTGTGTPKGVFLFVEHAFSDVAFQAIAWGNTAAGTIGQEVILARCTEAGGIISGYGMKLQGTGTRIVRYDAGVETTLATTTAIVAPGETVRIECAGTTIRAKRDGAVLLTATDATYASGLVGVGLHLASIEALFDDLCIEDGQIVGA